MSKPLSLFFTLLIFAACSSSNDTQPGSGTNTGGNNGGHDSTFVVTAFSPDTAWRNETVITLTGKFFPKSDTALHLTVGGGKANMLSHTDTSLSFMATDSSATGAVILNGKQ